jgi:hypothetical protein
MAVRRPQYESENRATAPLIGVFLREDGRQTPHYFTSEAEADRAVPDSVIEEALRLPGVWADLDLEAMLDELDRLRHETEPAPPLSL